MASLPAAQHLRSLAWPLLLLSLPLLVLAAEESEIPQAVDPAQELAQRVAAIQSAVSAQRQAAKWQAEAARIKVLIAAAEAEAARLEQEAYELKQQTAQLSSEQQTNRAEVDQLAQELAQWQAFEQSVAVQLQQLALRFADLEAGRSSGLAAADIAGRLQQALDQLAQAAAFESTVVVSGEEMAVRVLRCGPLLWWLSPNQQRGGIMQWRDDRWQGSEVPNSGAAIASALAMVDGKQPFAVIALPLPARALGPATEVQP